MSRSVQVQFIVCVHCNLLPNRDNFHHNGISDVVRYAMKSETV